MLPRKWDPLLQHGAFTRIHVVLAAGNPQNAKVVLVVQRHRPGDPVDPRSSQMSDPQREGLPGDIRVVPAAGTHRMLPASRA